MRAHGGVDPNAITTTEWLKQWLAERVSDHAISPAVAYNYGKIIEHHLVPAIGSVRLQDLRDANIRSLKSELLRSRKPVTVRKILGLLRRALNSAVTQELLARNPALTVPMPSPKHGKRTAGRSMGARSRNCSGSQKIPSTTWCSASRSLPVRGRQKCSAPRGVRSIWSAAPST